MLRAACRPGARPVTRWYRRGRLDILSAPHQIRPALPRSPALCPRAALRTLGGSRAAHILLSRAAPVSSRAPPAITNELTQYRRRRGQPTNISHLITNIRSERRVPSAASAPLAAPEWSRARQKRRQSARRNPPGRHGTGRRRGRYLIYACRTRAASRARCRALRAASASARSACRRPFDSAANPRAK